MLFDSHTHLNSSAYCALELAALVEDIESSELAYVVDAAFDLESARLAIAHSEEYPWCYALVGVHPHDTEGMTDETLDQLRLLAQHPKAVAIGEIGLDFYWDHSPRDLQEHWFRKQIQLANELRMPIAIHSREADRRTMEILLEEGAFSEERKTWFPARPLAGSPSETEGDARILLHCFSGSAELGKEYLKLGATLSYAGPITYKNARKRVEAVEATPIERMLIETDAPYLTPEPLRSSGYGIKNMAPYIKYTAEKVAEIKGMTYEEVCRITTENARSFFGI